MPPRRVLPIRSRVDSNPSEPRADGDGDSNTATPVISAGGSSLGAASTHIQNPDLKSEKSIHVHKSKAAEEGKAAVEANGLKNRGNCPTEQADPKSSEMAIHEIMEDRLVAIINGKKVSVKVKLDAGKSEAKSAVSDKRPKRKRNNLYSSLAPSVMNAIVEERAKSYVEAPQRLQKQRRSSLYASPQKIDPKNVDPAVLDAESAAQASGGKVPQEYLGYDGNLFYCRICLGVGEVVCCDGCPQVFHPACIPEGPSKSSLDNDDDPWYCPECIEKGLRGKSVEKTKRKRKKVYSHQDEAVEKTEPSSPPRRNKKRCGTCNKKSVENFPLVECSKQSCAALLHFPGCPDRVQRDVYASVDPKFGPLCPDCSDDIRSKSKGKGKAEEKEKAKGGKGGGRGSSKGGRGAGKGGRGHASNGGKGSFPKTSPPREALPEIGLKPSGYQAPYIEDDEETTGPGSLAFVEKPTGSIPAFFFFLINNRNAIERSLQKKDRSFRSMAKSVARNEMVAEQGAAIWLGLTDREKRAWIDLSLSDFQDRVIAWKEKEAIEAMMQVDVDRHKDSDRPGESDSKVSPSCDEKHAADFRARTLQFSRINTTLMKPSKGNKNNNSVLLELLNDSRFHPVPLVNARRGEKDEFNYKQSERAVEQFFVQGPIRTSVGDECMGCVRGWSHFCPILKRTIPNSVVRAALQPPAGSLSATRIGLGLGPKGRTRGEDSRHSLHDPSLRRDDVTTFVEDCMAVKTIFPNPDEHISKAPALGEVDPSVENMGSRKRKRPSDTESAFNEPEVEKRRYKCGRCLTVQFSPFGCIGCRREQLVKDTAMRESISTPFISADFLNGSRALSNSHNYDEGFLKSKCVMLHHATPADSEVSYVESKRSRPLTTAAWTPNAILPPEPKHLPRKNTDDFESDSEVSSDGSDSSTCSASETNEDQNSESAPPPLAEAVNRDITNAANENESHDKPHELRKSRRNVVDSEVATNRQLVALKHKETANELSRKCLSIACSGILMGMVRRDPLRLFAKPAPSSMEEYHKVIKNPIDFQTMRRKLLENEYATLGSFINDAKRLCINACVFNAADSVYALTAKQIFDSLLVMIKRAQQWITILKNKQASSLHDDSDDGGSAVDIFRDVESMWPGAVELLNNGSWLERDAQSDFVRTKENEIAYYGALALRRAALAATECFRLETEEEQTHLPVVKRSHIGDEMLRESIDRSVSLIDGPASLREHPDWREEQLLKLLKIVQKHRVDIRSSSESGCARCDEKKGEEERSEAVSMLRTSAKTTPDTAKARVDPSRSFQSTGLASRNARESSAAEKSDELIGTVASESMVSVKGSEIHGWGLYADCRFTSGDIVAEYIGEYISNAIANVREKYYRKQRIQDYQFRVNENVVIDATLKGGYARYINHSCQPNCVARILEGEPPNVHLMRVMIIAKKDIEAGDELTYDYHFPLETDLANRVPCNCGSKHCRGYMNWDIPEKMKKWKLSRKAEKGRVNSKKT